MWILNYISKLFEITDSSVLEFNMTSAPGVNKIIQTQTEMVIVQIALQAWTLGLQKLAIGTEFLRCSSDELFAVLWTSSAVTQKPISQRNTPPNQSKLKLLAGKYSTRWEDWIV